MNMYIVDRIEEGILVCENMETGKIEKFKKAEGISEGDVIKVADNEIVIDEKLTLIRKNRIYDKINVIRDETSH